MLFPAVKVTFIDVWSACGTEVLQTHSLDIVLLYKVVLVNNPADNMEENDHPTEMFLAT